MLSKFKLINLPNLVGIMIISQVFILSFQRTMNYNPTFDSISSSEMDAIIWINDNLPDQSNFVILTQAHLGARSLRSSGFRRN